MNSASFKCQSNIPGKTLNTNADNDENVNRKKAKMLKLLFH